MVHHFILVPRYIRCISTNPIPTRGMNIEKQNISYNGYAKIHQQRPFFDNRKDISKIVVLKIQTVSICIAACSTPNMLLVS